jgi:hypothetical protein
MRRLTELDTLNKKKLIQVSLFNSLPHYYIQHLGFNIITTPLTINNSSYRHLIPLVRRV